MGMNIENFSYPPNKCNFKVIININQKRRNKIGILETCVSQYVYPYVTIQKDAGSLAICKNFCASLSTISGSSALMVMSLGINWEFFIYLINT